MLLYDFVSLFTRSPIYLKLLQVNSVWGNVRYHCGCPIANWHRKGSTLSVTNKAAVKQRVAQHRVFLATDIHGERHTAQREALGKVGNTTLGYNSYIFHIYLVNLHCKGSKNVSKKHTLRHKSAIFGAFAQKHRLIWWLTSPTNPIYHHKLCP